MNIRGNISSVSLKKIGRQSGKVTEDEANGFLDKPSNLCKEILLPVSFLF